MVLRLGEDSVFMDVDSIQPGDDFVEILDRTLNTCRAILVVIDPFWISARDQAGRRRLDNPWDFVRIEIENALRQGILVIPVLVDGATMPSPGDLPVPLRALAARQAVELSASRFRYDVNRILEALSRVLGDSDWRARQPTASPIAESAETRSAGIEVSMLPSATMRHAYDLTSGIIPADADIVWDILVASLSSFPSPRPGLAGIEEITAGPPRIGYRYRERLRLLLLPVTNLCQFVRFERPRLLATLRTGLNPQGDPTSDELLTEYHLLSTQNSTVVNVRAFITWQFGRRMDQAIYKKLESRHLASICAEAERAARRSHLRE